MKNRANIAKIEDVYEVPLRNGRRAFVHYIYSSNDMGCLVKVFDYSTTDELQSTSSLPAVGQMFPPVFVGLKGAIAAGRWRKIGSLPIPTFSFPTFRCTSASKPGVYDNWWLWDGVRQWFIGKLPENLRSLEVQVVWGYEMLEERILTGKNIFAEVV